MELFKDTEGQYKPLASKNVDTGAGLERIAVLMQKTVNNFETDLLYPILEELCKLAKVDYTCGVLPSQNKNLQRDLYLKIVTDHARCATFLVADGVRTSNIGRGYVLRFIIRRAARFGRLLGLNKPFIYKLVPKVVELYKGHYKELNGQEEAIASVIAEEEERFAKTIDRGMTILDELLSDSSKEISGRDAFNLHATYGFPVELTAEIAEEKGKTIEMQGYGQAKEEHEKVSAGNKFNVIITGEEALGRLLKEHGTTTFTGYENLSGYGQVIALIREGKLVDHVEEGEEVEVVLDQTPFYAESGGQVGDVGLMSAQEGSLGVIDTRKHEGLHVHKVKGLSGVIETNQKLEAKVDKDKREATVLNHSTAHLFHAAVRQLLGKQVVQSGQQVNPDTMRFDFTYEKQLDKRQLSQIESLMNEWVRLNYPVSTVEMPLEESKKTGAIAMFGEKYGASVRVVKMGDISLEFCGGTHVSATGEIGPIKIISEGSIASGIRRVEALTGPRAWQFISSHMNILSTAAEQLKIKPAELLSQLDRLQSELKQKDKLAQALEEKLALNKAAELLAQAERIGSINLIAKVIPDITSDGLKALCDFLRNKGDDYVVVLATTLGDDKVSIATGVSNTLVKRGINAGKLVKEVAAICGGGGGGRPELAQAGGREPGRLNEALKKARELITQEVNAKA